MLTATAALGSRFVGWSGAGCSGTGTCALVITTDTTVAAEFVVVAPGANLALSVQTPPSVRTGDPFTVRYTVANTGPVTARDVLLAAALDNGVVLTGPLPAGCLLTAGTGIVVCNLGTLVGGDQATISLPVRSRVVGATCDVWGTSGPDHLIDPPGQAHVLCGLGGTDLIEAGDGIDTVFGNAPPGTRPFTAGFAGTVTSRLLEVDATDNRATTTLLVLLGPDGTDDLDCGQGTDQFAEEPAAGLLRNCEQVVGTLPTLPTQPPTAGPEPAAPAPSPTPAPTPAPIPTPLSGVSEAEASLGSPSTLPGGVAQVAGSGCQAGEAVAFSIAGAPVGAAIADAAGSYRASVQVPNLPIGRHTIEVRCGAKVRSLPIDLVVSTQAITSPATTTTAGLILLFVILAGLFVLQIGPATAKSPDPVPLDDED